MLADKHTGKKESGGSSSSGKSSAASSARSSSSGSKSFAYSSSNSSKNSAKSVSKSSGSAISRAQDRLRSKREQYVNEAPQSNSTRSTTSGSQWSSPYGSQSSSAPSVRDFGNPDALTGTLTAAQQSAFASTGSGSRKATDTARGRAQLEKARAYQETEGTNAGYWQRAEDEFDAATRGTRAETPSGFVRGSSQDKIESWKAWSDRKKIESYLRSGNTNSEQTSNYLELATENAEGAGSEKDYDTWRNLADSLNATLGEDQAREKRENSWLHKAWNSITGGNRQEGQTLSDAKGTPIPLPEQTVSLETQQAVDKAREKFQQTGDPEDYAELERRQAQAELEMQQAGEAAEQASRGFAGEFQKPGAEAESTAPETGAAEAEPGAQTAEAVQQEQKTSDRLEELLRQYNEVLPNYDTSANAANAVTSLEREIAAENRALGNDPYYGLDENAQNRQGAGGFAKGLASGLNAFAGTTLLAADMAIYNPDLHPEMQDEQLVELMGERDRLNDRLNALAAGEDGTATAEERPSLQEQYEAAWEKWQTTFAPEDYAEVERLQAQLGSDESAEDTENLTEQLEAVEAQIRARREELGLGPEEEMPESNSALGEKGWSLLQYGADMAEAGNQDWANYLEGMSDTERFFANVLKTGGEMVFDMTANTILPGSGTIMMAARKGGSRAIEQLGKENDDRGSIALACFTGAGTAYLSERLVGGAELAYNRSLFGSITEKMFENASPAVQWIAKRLLNTEGIEEGLENGLDYAADRILGLDPEERFDFDATKQDMLVGWILGTIFNGTLGGEQYDAERIRSVVDEGLEFVQSGMTLDEAKQIALDTTKQDVVVKAGKTDEKAPQAEEQYNLSGENGLTYSALSPEAQAGTEPNAEAQLPDTIPANTKATDLKRGGGQVSYDGATVDGVTYAPVDTANLTRTQKNQINALEAVAKATGANIVFFQSNINEKGQYVGANGFYKNGTVYLDVNAGLESRTADGSTVGEVAIVRTASHELTHFIQEFDRAEYETMRDYVLGTLADQSGAESIEDLIQQKMDRDASGQLTREEAIDEVIADGCELMLKDSKAIERLAVEQPSLATRIRDWIRNWAASIRAAFEGIGATHREAQILMDHADRLQAMWDAALENAARNNRTGDWSTGTDTVYSGRDIGLESDGSENNNDIAVNLNTEAENIRFSEREMKEPENTQYGFKLMNVDADGLPHAMFIDAAKPYEFNKWYAAEAPGLAALMEMEPGYAYLVDGDNNVDIESRRPITKKGSSFSGLPGKGLINQATNDGKRWMTVTLDASGKKAVANVGINGSGGVSTFAMRPGIHAVDIPSMKHIGSKSEGATKIDTRRPDQRWFLIEYPVDQDYNQEAFANPKKDIRDHLPENGWYSFQTNSGAEAKQHWFITGGMKIVGAVSEADVRKYAADRGFEEDLPWKLGKSYSDDDAIDLDEYIRTTKAQPTPSKTDMYNRITAGAPAEYGLKATKNEEKAAVVPDAQNASEEAFVTVDGKQEKIPAVRYSLRSMRHDVQDGKMFDDLAKHTNMNTTEIENLRSGLNHLMDVITLNRDILDMNETYGREDRPFKPYKPNSDPLYTISLDFSTLCRKRLMTQYVIEKLQTELTDSETGKRGRALSAEEQLAVRDLMKEYAEQDKALKVACAMCYVEAARLKAPKQITKFIRDPESAMLRYFALKNKDFNASVKEAQADFKEKHGYDRKAAKKDMKPADVRALNSLSNKLRNSYGDNAHPASAEELEAIRIAKTLPNETYLTAANLAKLAEEHPVIYDAYTATIRTATRSKSLEADIPYYYGDSQGAVSDEFIRNVNAENGMRFSSWSDFQIQHMLDMMTAVIELGSRNTSMHGYTKFLEQVRIFGKTGMMFNMSGVPQGTGLKADGSLDFSPTESVLVHSEDGSEYDAIKARDEFPETAGLQCIGISPEHIKALLDSDIIDYIIPYHTSGLNASLRRMAQISNWDDFTAFQNAAEDKSIRFDPKVHDKETWHKEPVFSEFFNAARDPANGYQEGEQGIVTMRRAADIYKQMCAERGLKPKFSWANSKVNADFSNDPNYWKLLIDRKMINQKTGTLIEQKPVRPDFDFDLIESMVQEAVDSYDPTLQDRALSYVRDHFSELPKRISDLKKSGAVKKAVANSKKVDELTRSFNELQAGVVAAATAGNLKGENGQTKSPQFQLRENGTGRIPWRNNPFFDTGANQNQQSNYDAQNPFGVGTQNNAQNGAGAQGASQGTNIPPANQNANTEGSTGTKPVSGKEKVSQFFSNTLTKREGENVGDPLTYITKTEAETLESAVRRLNNNPDAEIDLLKSTTMWTDEQVKMAKVLGSNLFAEAQKSGDMTAYNAFRKVEREHATAIARALRAYGQDPDTELSAESVARMAERFFSLVEDGAVPEVGTMTPEQIETAKKQVTETTSELAQLEAREKESRDSGMSEEEAWEKVKEDYLNAAQRLVAQRNVGMLIDNLAGKNKALRKGAENVTTALRRFLASESPDYIKRYVYANAAGISSDLKYKGSFTLDKGAKWISSMQKLCQLFGSSTTLRNLEGNTGAGAIAFLSNNGAKVAADQLIGLFSGNRTAGFEKGVFSKGNWGESWKAVRRSILEISANMDMGGKYTTTGTSAFNPYNSVDRLFNRANQILSYALNTSDAGFVGMAQASAADAALRGSKRSGGKMTEETAQKIGRNEAEYQTFKNDTKIQKGLEAARNFLDLLGVGGKVRGAQRTGGFGLGTAVAPYIQVPVNIALKGVEYSPIGAVKGMADAGKAIKAAKNSKPDTKAGQEAMVLQNKAAGEIGRGITGTALVMLLAHLMKKAKEEDKEWFRDWNLESDPNVRAQNKAEGKSGQQINMTRFRQLVRGEDFSGKWDNGDELVNISSIEPLNQYIGIASMLADDDGQYSAADYLTALYTSTRDSIEDISAISSINQFADTFKYNKVYRTTIEEDEEGNPIEDREADTLATAAQATGAMLGNAASGFIPAPVRHAAQFGDEYQRETRGENAMQTAWNQVLSSIPGARETLPVKTDNFGRKMTQGDRSTRFKNTYGPNKHTQLDQSDVSREMEAIRDATDQVLLPDRMGPSSVKIGDKTVYPSVKERGEWGDENGSNTERAMQLAMRNPVYRNAGYKTRAEMVKEYEKYIRDGMKEDYAREHGIEFESKYEAARSMDNPISYLTSKKQFSLAEKGGDWDVVDTLIGPLENMTAADQERSREREGDRSMWSFFDFLTTNPEGYKASSAQAVHDYKEGAKARAAARGVQSAGSKDRLQEIKSGLVSGKYSSADADAFFSKQQSDGDWELSKGYYAIYAAARAAGATPLEAIAAIEGADRDGNGTLDEYGYRKKAKYEVSRAVKGGGFDMSEFDRVYNKK